MAVHKCALKLLPGTDPCKKMRCEGLDNLKSSLKSRLRIVADCDVSAWLSSRRGDFFVGSDTHIALGFLQEFEFYDFVSQYFRVMDVEIGSRLGVRYGTATLSEFEINALTSLYTANGIC